MKTVMFVCTGNTCRSPMAQGLFADLVKGRKDIEVVSAGVGAVTGQSPTEYGVEVMNEIGIDISHIRSPPVVADLVRKADYIFVMTYGHLDSMLLLFPMAADKTFLLREFETQLPVMEREVVDPVGMPIEAYRRSRDEIRHSLPRLLDMVLRSAGSPSSVASVGKQVYFGADAHSIELKEAVQAWLAENDYTMQDCSPTTPGGDFVLRVARAVAGGDAEFGILISPTGVTTSIAANKVSGVRVALVHSKESAQQSREQDDANVLCLASLEVKPKRVKEILEVWLNTAFKGDKQEKSMDKTRTENKMEKSKNTGSSANTLAETDPIIFNAIADERRRQTENLELIPSENCGSRAVLEALGTCLTDKYAEGYPGRRWYGGCEFVDIVEQVAIDRMIEIFGAEHVNVQPHSGAQANMAVYFAMLQPGDPILTMELAHGGHLTHGHPKNFSGRFYKVTHYGVNKDTEMIDYDQVAALAMEHRPKMITAGASAYPRVIDFERMREIADACGALLFIDMAHIAGLVAAGVHPSPVPHADFVTTTTHKTLRGPRGGVIMCKEKYAKEIDSQVFPGIQGGPLMHVIAAKAVCFAEALRPEFKTYQQQVVRNAKALCEGMKKNGYRIVSGGTDNHLMLVDVRPQNLTGKEVQETLDQCAITVNKNTIPFDTLPPVKSGGIRMGSPVVTTRGMKEDEMFDIAGLIHEGITNRGNIDALKKIREKVIAMTARFPLPS